ncbi:hypothetical protein D5266_09570, partial [bacterium c-19]|nr:hypothetical protein [bacterium c-19]
MKKLFTLMALLLITSTSAYTFYSGRLNASNPYASGGSITGRINKSPANLIVQNEHMRKGDRILMGVTNPYTNDPLSWQLIRKQTYNDYGCSTPSVSCNNSNTINAWLSLTNNPVGYMKAGFIPNDFTVAGGAIATSFTDLQDRRVAFTSYRNVVSLLDSLNTDVKNSNDKMILTYRDLTLIHKIYNVEGGAINTRSAASMKQSIFARTSDHMDSLFLPNSYELIPEAFNTDASLVPPAKDIAFSNNYMSSAAGWDNTNLASCILILESGTRNLSLMGNNWDNENFIRLEAFLNMENVVFGVSTGNTSTLGNITVPTLSGSYTRLYQDAVGEPMKVRIENSVLSSSTSFHQIENAAQNAISKAAKNESVYLNVDAQTGNDGAGGIYTVSALIFNENGDFLYYKPLEAAKGRGQYELNLTGIPIGKYKIGVVNEAYNENSTAPADCSAITNVQALEIVEPHKITYTKTPQSGASAGKEYEFSKNVNAGQAVGKVTANPTGVTPLTYTLETNGDNSYLNFEIDGLDSNNASSSTPLNVKIKSGAPDLVNGGLKAGTYKFCVSAKDANGDPVDTNGDPTEKVCTSFTVEKTDLSIAFNDPTQTKKSISDAATSWNETATANPNTGTKITYSVSGGDVSLISINPDTGAITYTGSNAFGKVKIKATVDDDPSTGHDNYNSAFVEKEIVIYREVDGSVTPDSNSSDTTTPTFTASDSNISTGGIIGTIHGTLGTPDTIGGTTTTYHYGLKPGVGNA